MHSSALRPKILLLVLVGSLLLTFLNTPPVKAQSASVVFNDVSATVRFKVGVKFNIKAKATGVQFEGLEVRVKYGSRGTEKVYGATIQRGDTVDTSYSISRQEEEGLVAGIPLFYTWTATLTGGAKVNGPPSTVFYEDNRFSWYQIESEKVTVRWYSGDNTYGQQMFSLAQNSLLIYQKRYNMITTKPVYVSIYGSQKDFASAYDGQIPAWAGGVAYPDIGEISLIVPQDDLTNQYIGYGIPHELAHAALYQFVGKAVPHWLDEGFAVYNQTQISPDYLKLVKDAAQNNRLLTFSSITQTFPKDSNQAKLAYAQSRSIVDFMINKFGDPVWTNFLDQLRRNSLEGAIQATYGVDFTTMEGFWRNYIVGKPSTLPNPLLTGAVSSSPNQPKTPPPITAVVTQNLLRPEILVIGGVVLMAIAGLGFVLIRSGRRKTASLYATDPDGLDDTNPFVTPSPDEENPLIDDAPTRMSRPQG